MSSLLFPALWFLAPLLRRTRSAQRPPGTSVLLHSVYTLHPMVLISHNLSADFDKGDHCPFLKHSFLVYTAPFWSSLMPNLSWFPSTWPCRLSRPGLFSGVCSSYLILTQVISSISMASAATNMGMTPKPLPLTQTALLCQIHLSAFWTPAPGCPRAP